MNRNRFLIILGLIVSLVLGFWLGQVLRPENFQLRGALTFDPAQVPSATYEVGRFVVNWQPENGGQLTIASRDNPAVVLWQTLPGEAFVMAARGELRVQESQGIFQNQENQITICTHQYIDQINVSPGYSFGKGFNLAGHLICREARLSYNLYFYTEGDNPALNVWLDPNTSYNRVILNYASAPDEHFFGFGEQFTHADMKGQRVPIWVSEQGVGRGEQPLTFLADLTNGGAGGDAFTTYAPMPYYITNKARGLYLLNDNYSIFDLRKPDRVQIYNFSNFIYGRLITGSSPADLINFYAHATGPMAELPDWIFSGAIVGMQGGTAQVEKVYAELKQRSAPISAFWLQDWVGKRATSFGSQLWWNWELDTDQYPNWEQLRNQLQKDNVRILLYINPHLVDVSEKTNARRNLYKEAIKNNYVILRPDGSPYLQRNTSFDYVTLDLSNEKAVEWFKTVIQENLINIGASGWMADFGESFPVDAKLTNPIASVEDMHNYYPVMWAGLNNGVAKGKDIIFFSRSGYTYSQYVSPLFWEGDQLVDWSAEDGIKSAVTGLNTSGLSGMAFNHSDIGGYTTITNPLINIHRSRELLYRWMEMNAFTLIFRTHEGNQPDKNVQFYTDSDTLDTFAYWAKVYAALFDYRKQLVQEATETGLPVVRHPFIQYPNDPETWKITYQEFMLGADFLIAPVTDSGAGQVKVYLPKGRWVHVWSGKVYEGGRYLTIAAPLGQPAVFYVEGSQAGQDFVNKLKSQHILP